MRDISEQLSKIIKDQKCSSLLAFIVVKDGIYIHESKSNEQPCGRLRDQRDIDTDR